MSKIRITYQGWPVFRLRCEPGDTQIQNWSVTTMLGIWFEVVTYEWEAGIGQVQNLEVVRPPVTSAQLLKVFKTENHNAN
jgi:hypothetical protein